MSFDGVAKTRVRGGVLSLSNLGSRKGKIVYLDDGSAGGTRFFLSSGVEKSRLVPVNWRRDDCDAITASTGVNAICASLAEYLSSLDGHVDMVWFDGMTRTLDPCIVREALRVSPFLEVTLSTRGASHLDVVEGANKVVRKSKGRISSSPMRCEGKSGIANMVHLSITRRLFNKVEGKKKQAKKKQAKKKQAKKKQAIKKEAIKKEAIKKEAIKKEAKALLGRKICIPCGEWESVDATQLEALGVKKEKGGFVFRVDKTHHKNRLAVRALRVNNVPFPDLEKWVLTPDQVSEYTQS